MGTLAMTDADLQSFQDLPGAIPKDLRQRKRLDSKGNSINDDVLGRPLMAWHEIPNHLRFNRFVWRHYRPMSDWQGCVMSLLYIHNEQPTGGHPEMGDGRLGRRG